MSTATPIETKETKSATPPIESAEVKKERATALPPIWYIEVKAPANVLMRMDLYRAANRDAPTAVFVVRGHFVTKESKSNYFTISGKLSQSDVARLKAIPYVISVTDMAPGEMLHAPAIVAPQVLGKSAMVSSAASIVSHTVQVPKKVPEQSTPAPVQELEKEVTMSSAHHAPATLMPPLPVLAPVAVVLDKVTQGADIPLVVTEEPVKPKAVKPAVVRPPRPPSFVTLSNLAPVVAPVVSTPAVEEVKAS